jgi:hypothetical protein
MMEFLSTYGLWILLLGIFLAMHRFGMGCCEGGRRLAAERRDEDAGAPPGPAAETTTPKRYARGCR